MTHRYLDAILRYMSREDYTHRDNIPIILADYYAENPNCTLEEFMGFIRSIKNDFFRINRIHRPTLSREIFQILKEIPPPAKKEMEIDHSGSEKLEALLLASKQAEVDHQSIIKKLDETLKLISVDIQSMIKIILNTLTSMNEEFASIRSSEVMNSIRQRLISKRQEKQIELLEDVKRNLSKFLFKMRKDKTKAEKILGGIKELGVSITSEVIATVLLKIFGFNA